MISPQDIVLVGRTQKPYSIKGEINILFNKAEYADIENEYYLLMLDNIPVPFFIEEFTFTTDVNARVKFEDINDEKAASEYTNIEIYVPRKLVDVSEEADLSGWNYFVGYKVVGVDGDFIGTITSVDDSTLNVLFVLHNEDEEILIPATEDFISAIDEENKIIKMDLPEGLLEE